VGAGGGVEGLTRMRFRSVIEIKLPSRSLIQLVEKSCEIVIGEAKSAGTGGKRGDNRTWGKKRVTRNLKRGKKGITSEKCVTPNKKARKTS